MKLKRLNDFLIVFRCGGRRFNSVVCRNSKPYVLIMMSAVCCHHTVMTSETHSSARVCIDNDGVTSFPSICRRNAAAIGVEICKCVYSAHSRAIFGLMLELVVLCCIVLSPHLYNELRALVSSDIIKVGAKFSMVYQVVLLCRRAFYGKSYLFFTLSLSTFYNLLT